MKKVLFSLMICISFATAGLVDAIAMIVNDTPITLQDIDDQMVSKDLSKPQAVGLLIDKVLYDQELKKRNISVDIFDIENQISKIAARNNMSVIDFKAAVRQQQDYQKFEDQIKKQLIHQKLIVAIAKGKLKIATDDDIKIYYEAHKNDYTIAKKIDVVVYMSKSKQALLNQKQNPMQQNQDVVTQSLVLDQTKLSPQIKYIVNHTDINSFSPIFAQNRQYNMFFIKDKRDITVLTLEQVKNEIFQTIMKQREDKYLKEYFETLKLTATIKVLR